MGKTKIEWAQASWNPVTGCTPISEGCEHCYAKRMATRLRGRCGYPAGAPFLVKVHPDRYNEPFGWRKSKKIFVCSMGDLFHEDVPFPWINEVFSVIQRCTHHRFMVLTKRPERMRNYISKVLQVCGWPESDIPFPNVWMGITAETQRRADERIPVLLEIPAARRFVSVEPMLGPVDLKCYLQPGRKFHMSLNVKGALLNKYSMDALHDDDGRLMSRGEAKERLELLDFQGIKYVPSDDCDNFDPQKGCLGHTTPALDWVICGGETGPGARPVHPDWVRSLRDQCQMAGTPFFFKSWGDWRAFETPDVPINRDWVDGCFNGDVFYPGLANTDCKGSSKKILMFHVGKKAAGRLLDGRTWDDEPK